MSTHFGIDFGTTNSAAVKLIGAEIQKYGDEAGQPLPSVVALDCATGEASCGREVWQKREEYRRSGNYHVIESIKRYLGTDETWPTEAKVWTPEDVASVVLRHLSSRAAKLGLEGISQAVITIPVDYSPEARRALRRAASKAGIEVTTFVTESTAALVRHFPQLQHCRYVAVFDWGGGTLDVSVLEIRDGRVLELATEGMDIAGDAIDDDFAQATQYPSVTPRYFVDKFPMFLPMISGSPIVTFTYVAPEAENLVAFVTHLQNYLPLFRSLKQFRFLFVSPCEPLFPKARAVFSSVVKGPLEVPSVTEITRYFQVRKLWESRQFAALRNEDIEFLNEATRKFAAPHIQSVYKEWRAGSLTEAHLVSLFPASDTNRKINFDTCAVPSYRHLYSRIAA